MAAAAAACYPRVGVGWFVVVAVCVLLSIFAVWIASVMPFLSVVGVLRAYNLVLRHGMQNLD